MGLMLRRAGLLAALLALFGQLLLGTAMPHPSAEATLAELLGDPGAICHAGGGGPGHSGHGDPDCPLCPVCAVLHHTMPLPAAPPAMPLRRAGLIGTVARPVVPRQAAEPRGPPTRA
jgi:hypothetical protein